jgi:hypothetical protein
VLRLLGELVKVLAVCGKMPMWVLLGELVKVLAVYGKMPMWMLLVSQKDLVAVVVAVSVLPKSLVEAVPRLVAHLQVPSPEDGISAGLSETNRW